MALQSYLVDDPSSFEALLTTCNTCMPNKSLSCPDCTGFTSSVTLTGEDPDSGSNNWTLEDVGGNNAVNSRTNDFHRFPYQIKTSSVSLSCNSNCAYLVRIQYKLETSSARRSFFQSGFSDIWIVERWSGSNIQEIHYVANSVPWDYLNSEIIGAYSAGQIAGAKKSGSSAGEAIYFNPYGLRENYDPLKNSLETHCGTLLFFAKGDDTIKFRLAQHTRLRSGKDINPEANTIRTNGSIQGPRYDYSGGNYGATGNFQIKAYTRPVPGKLKLSDKNATATEYQLKYHPHLFSS